MIKQELTQRPELKQKLSLSRSMKRDLESLKQSNHDLLSALTEMANVNPFLEFTPSIKGQELIETGIAQKSSLKEELYLQLHTNQHTYHKDSAVYIIESLDKHGFFTIDIQQACSDVKVATDTFIKTLGYIQTFEPIGVAARNAEESLIIQLKHKGLYQVADFLSKYKEEIIKQDYLTICQKEKITVDTIRAYLEQIRTCHPYPCENDCDDSYSYILPEFEIKIIGEQIVIKPQSIGDIHLSDSIKMRELDENLKKYFNQAKFMIDSLNKRNKTLLIVANELFEIQKSHFLYQDELKSCTLKDLSIKTGFSQSTISRALNGKYYLFQERLYSLSDLLVSSTKSGSSKDAIMKAIQLYIDDEDKNHPLQDEQIKQELEKIELFVSRRTIVKYRKEMGIPHSKDRKKAYKQHSG